MKHEALRVDYADDRALVCLVGKSQPGESWEHVRTLASIDAETGDIDDAARRWGSRLQLAVLS